MAEHDDLKDTQNPNDMNGNDESGTEQGCCTELADTRQRYLYLHAEFENYKKRVEKERIQWINSGQAIIISEFLPIIDDFERAMQELQKHQVPAELKAFAEGFELISRSIHKFLKKNEIEEIKETEFNPELHEAVMQVESTAHKSGDIVQVLQKGYRYKGQLLRPAQVSVAK